MDNAITQLHNYLAKMAAVYGKQPPKVNYEFQFNESLQCYRCRLILVNETFESGFYTRKKQAKEAASVVALQRLTENDIIKPYIPMPRHQPVCVQPSQHQLQLQQHPQAPMVNRIHVWLESAVAASRTEQKPYTALLTELAQVIQIEMPRYDISQVYHMIGGRTHAPYAVVLYIDRYVIKTPEPFDKLQDAKNWCANQAITTLVQDFCGITQWPRMDARNGNNNEYDYQVEGQQPASPMTITYMNDGDDTQRTELMHNNPCHGNNSTATLAQAPAQGRIIGGGKKQIISGFNTTERAMLNEVAAKHKWDMPSYDIEETRSPQTNETVFRCSVRLSRPEEAGGDITVQGEEWSVSKNQAKHHTASLVLDILTREGFCIIVR